MGQYYKPLLIGDNGAMQTASPTEYGNGFKLMEHSWVGNNFVNVILQRLDSAPQRLAWIGDYADGLPEEKYHLGGGYIDGEEAFMRYYNAVWGEDTIKEAASLGGSLPAYRLSNEEADCFIVNFTKNCYIDMEEYVAENKVGDYCINPVPLLTSVGNGEGGGDYHGNEPEVGSWAFDRLYVTILRPAKMEKVMFHFHE